MLSFKGRPNSAEILPTGVGSVFSLLDVV